jgi:hypothetical protein
MQLTGSGSIEPEFKTMADCCADPAQPASTHRNAAAQSLIRFTAFPFDFSQ